MSDTDTSAAPSAVPSSSRVPVAVIMERTAIENRWATERWECCGVVHDAADGDGVRVIVEHPDRRQVLHPGFDIVLHRHEAEGYYLNITSPEPKVFVLWRQQDGGDPQPELLTVSYNEGTRWADSGEQVDGVALPRELLPWIARFVAEHYEPEPPKRKRYANNRDQGRMGRTGP